MAKALWGNVYYKDIYAGRLEETAGGRVIFTYDKTYVSANHPKIAYTLPVRSKPYISEQGLHPFFDNLVAEGWFRNAQARALGVDTSKRFALLLGFGYDLAGAVSIIDPDAEAHHPLDHTDEATLAVLLGRASLSGVQRKILVVKDGKQFRPVGQNEISTHIAKLTSGNLSELLELEYLTTKAVQALLPDDEVVSMEIQFIPSIKEEALIIPRFDRTLSGKRLHHFEEFNQLLAKKSGDDKYEGGYEDMGQFILNNEYCIPAESYRLLCRVLTCLLVGNTDAHFKNFAMFHTRDGLRLTPAYDLVASSYYKDFQSIALHVANAKNLSISKLKPKHLLALAEGYGVNQENMIEIIKSLGTRISHAQTTIEQSNVGNSKLKSTLINIMEKRWNGSFALIGKL